MAGEPLSPDRWTVLLSSNPLELSWCTDFVADPGAGAISTFSGVTRDNFHGKTVLKLEYECYQPMALKMMQKLCEDCLARYDVIRIAVAHRLGEVGVGSASVLIAVSAAHRLPAIQACHWAIDTLKATVPIWKKEYYADGSTWKENEESRLLQTPAA